MYETKGKQDAMILEKKMIRLLKPNLNDVNYRYIFYGIYSHFRNPAYDDYHDY